VSLLMTIFTLTIYRKAGKKTWKRTNALFVKKRRNIPKTRILTRESTTLKVPANCAKNVMNQFIISSLRINKNKESDNELRQSDR
jgi:hypothetical protein